jgi:hypothetical protein
LPLTECHDILRPLVAMAEPYMLALFALSSALGNGKIPSVFFELKELLHLPPILKQLIKTAPPALSAWF